MIFWGSETVNKHSKDAPIDGAAMAMLLCLQLVTEGRMAAGLDADGSETCGRAMSILGHWERIGAVANADGTPFAPAARGQIRALRRAIDRAEPILARIVRPVMRRSP